MTLDRGVPGSPTRAWVGPLDAEFAGPRVWILVGPSQRQDSSGYREILTTIAAGGPRHRVGLQPRNGRFGWEFDPGPGAASIADVDVLDPTDTEAVLNQLVGRDVDAPVFAANLAGYLAISFDHGIGDAHAFVEVIAALTNPGPPTATGFVAPVPACNVKRPTTVVARRVLGAVARELVGDIRHELTVRATSRGQAAAAGTTPELPVHGHTGYRVAFVRSAPGYFERLRQIRDEFHPGVSTTALMFHTVRRRLIEAGIPLTETTGVLTDLRRYLRPGESTLANLSTVVQVATPEDSTLADFAANLRRSMRSSYPATRALAAAAVVAVKSRSGKANQRDVTHAAGGVQLALSDVTKLATLRKFGFDSGAGDPVVAVALPPGAPHHLTVCFVRTRDELQVTATYHPDIVDHDALRGAVEQALAFSSDPRGVGHGSADEPALIREAP